MSRIKLGTFCMKAILRLILAMVSGPPLNCLRLISHYAQYAVHCTCVGTSDAFCSTFCGLLTLLRPGKCDPLFKKLAFVIIV